MRNNRYILLSNIVDGIKCGTVKSGNKELTEMKAEIATLIINLYGNY